MVRVFLVGILALLLASCGGEVRRKGVRAAAASAPAPKLQLLSPQNRTSIKNNERLTVSYRRNGVRYDSVVAILNGRRIARMADTAGSIMVEAKTLGTKQLKVAAFLEGKEAATATVSITILAPNAPKRYGYTVVNAYPHDGRAYTQGLQLHGDALYESTGIYGQSAVRKLDLRSGRVLQQKELDGKYFGEGICILNGLLYQLTWREQICLVYSCETLQPLAALPYSGEGWGLATDGEHLIMSNGSNVISFISPTDFAAQKHLEVYTDRGAVGQLNELELINGEIWANVYGSDNIVRIDTASGAVTGVVNMQNLLPSNLRDRNTDVLNGIACNEKTGQIFVTGKNWKKLFEIKITNTN
ncbi:MAG: glutaminyl-peptide cyclotransferase [Prevotellaceae bacterium]|jgi:glutamine cyclotransferase|nr:glutaminyl-peptide cyclotransferase [Prevotellaceae bacterium]